MKKITYFLGVLLCHTTAFASTGLEFTFIESAPKDRFEILNSGACDLTDVVVQIDLSPTMGKLIFDTTAAGAGVEVFQPFEKKNGDFALIETEVKDGDQQLSIGMDLFQAGQSVSFTIDVDDTLPNSDTAI